MKIYFFDKWKDTPLAVNSPVSTVGIKPISMLDTQRYNIPTITYYLDKLNQGNSTKSAKKYLVRLRAKDYINELIGEWNECIDFMRNCLSDEGILKEKLGRKRIRKE